MPCPRYLYALFVCIATACTDRSEALLNITLKDMDGLDVSLREMGAYKASAFVFFSPECPLSENYSLTVKELAGGYKGYGIPFYAIFPGTYYKRNEMDSFHRTFLAPLPALLDPDYRLAGNLSATVTPEAFLVGPDGSILYSGKIDNWAFSLGKQRRKATEHYLADAIDAVLSGKPVKVKRTKPVGCIIE